MKEITIIDIINCCCTVLSLILSIFAASSVIKIKKGNIKNKMLNINKGDLQQNNLNISNSNYSGNTITNIMGKEMPKLTENEYRFDLNQDRDMALYFDKIEKTVLKFSTKLNSLYFDIDFRNIYINPKETPFSGCSIKSIPMNDWRGFIKENYVLSFDYSSNCECEMQFEITSTVGKVFQNSISLQKDAHGSYIIKLSDFQPVMENWENVTEICFVFFPEKCMNAFGTIKIQNLCIRKS